MITFFSSRFLLNNLGTEDYGLYNVINSFILSLAIINTILITSTNRFIAVELGKKDSNVNHIFSNIFTLHLIVAFIVIILGKIIGFVWIENYLNIDTNKIGISHFVYNLSLITIFFNIITVPFISYQTANEDFKNQSNIVLIQSIWILGLAYALTYVENKLKLYSTFICIIYVVGYCSQIVYTISKYKDLKIKINLSKSIVKDVSNYSGWMSIGAIAYMLKNQGNSIVLNLFFGTKLNASYGIANQVYQQINGIISNLNKVFVPKIMKSHGSGDKTYQRYVGILSSRYLFYLGLFIALPLFINIDSILKIWLINPPQYASIFIKLLLLDMLLSLVNNGVSNMIFATGNVRNYQIVINSLNLVNLPLTYILFKLGFEPYYLVFTSIVFTLITNMFKIMFARKLLNIDFQYLYNNNYKYIIRLSIISFVIYYFFINDNFQNIFKILLQSISIEIMLLICIVLIGINKEEKNLIINKIKK